ncbi:MAG: site-specific DNA-methyltransferase, partial [Oscillospiraceae bacterium]
DGVIFISIDDNEQENLKKCCNEVFGENNFIALITVIVKTEGRRYGGFAKTHEQVLIYSKNFDKVTLNEIEIEGKKFQYYDEVGGFNIQDLRNQNARAFNSNNRPNLRYPFYVDLSSEDKDGFCKVYLEKNSNLTEVYPITVNGFKSVWRWGKNEKSSRQLNDLVGRKGTDGIIRIYQKMRKLTEMPKTVLMDKEFISIKGTRELQELLGIGVFDFPKPSKLIQLFESIALEEDSIILDFFSGSATTAHAVMQLNAEDGGHRKFIMVQLPEETDEKSEAYKAGYKNICEIGKERIRRAGEKIKSTNQKITITHEITPVGEEEVPLGDTGVVLQKTMFEEYKGETKLDIKELYNENLDTGFRVLKLDSSNMKDVYYNPADYEPSLFSSLEDNIKEDRTPEDLLFQVMLDLGVLLSSKIEETTIADKKVFNVENNYLMACFDDNVTEEVITEIAKQKPYYFVMRDSSMANDSVATNFEQIFAAYSPDTVRKVL